ncbi:YchJ family protein [Sphingobacterium hungaricum]
MTECPCGSERPYTDCCSKIHQDLSLASSAEQLMRARYAAFSLQLIDFIYDSFYWKSRKLQNKSDIADWAKANKWMKLELLNATENTVEFKAYYLNPQGEMEIHHELSKFKQDNKIWYYLSGKHA